MAEQRGCRWEAVRMYAVSSFPNVILPQVPDFGRSCSLLCPACPEDSRIPLQRCVDGFRTGCRTVLETTGDSAAPAVWPVRNTRDRPGARLMREGLGTAQTERDLGHVAIDARPIAVVYCSCGERDSSPAVRSRQPDVGMSGFLMSNAVSTHAQYVVVGHWIQPHRRSVSSLGNPGGPAGLEDSVSPFFRHLPIPPPT